ncbi:putative membrane protein [Methanosarcina siciliae C2J]|uniref:Putative membrane protein n=2 Tax=Methanosarcina siciliae TaxID=38027 RepID=A0A0E3LDG0_9EURY|nr:putative membrane protein [Methanosarcina siciliae C2J]
MTGVGALSGAFWGMLFGLIFLVPIFGMVVGAAIGALSASFADVGISDDFIKSVRSKVTEGTSALFLLTSDAVQDKVVEATRGMKFELIASNLSQEEEDKLREVFAEEEAAAPAH